MDIGWIDLTSEIVGLSAGPIWTIDIKSEVLLTETLRRLGFEICFFEGSRITSEASFFQEAAEALDFPEYFGMNWDAFGDCLGELLDDASPRMAIVWRDSSKSAAFHLATLIAATHMLLNAAQSVRDEKHDVAQFAVFLLGEGAGFVPIGEVV